MWIRKQGGSEFFGRGCDKIQFSKHFLYAAFILFKVVDGGLGTHFHLSFGGGGGGGAVSICQSITQKRKKKHFMINHHTKVKHVFGEHIELNSFRFSKHLQSRCRHKPQRYNIFVLMIKLKHKVPIWRMAEMLFHTSIEQWQKAFQFRFNASVFCLTLWSTGFSCYVGIYTQVWVLEEISTFNFINFIFPRL